MELSDEPWTDALGWVIDAGAGRSRRGRRDDIDAICNSALT
jgi:hypothetical protein